jgi:hypothetical protein
LSAGYDLQLAIQAIWEACDLTADSEEGKVSAATAHAALDDVGDQPQRALLGIGTAFNIGRITIVDADCYEAMGKVFNEFTKLRDALSGVGDAAPTAENMRPYAASLRTYTRKLDEDIFALVTAAQDNLPPAQTWRNKRKRAEVKKRLEAEYFKYPAEFG